MSVEYRPVKVRTSIITGIALGYLSIESVKKVRAYDKCWKCKATPDQLPHSMAVGFSSNTKNRLFCNPCGLILMEKGVRVVSNKLPAEFMRKYRLEDIINDIDNNDDI
jgi:hypothetical protein